MKTAAVAAGFLVLGFLVFLAAPLWADDPTVAPTRGGQILEFGYAQVRMEGVQQANGTIVLYALPVNGALPAEDLEPVVVLEDGTEVKTSRAGPTEWRATDPKLGTRQGIDVIRIGVGGKRAESKWKDAKVGGSVSLLLRETSSAPMCRYGGVMVPGKSAWFEFVQDPSARSLSLYGYDAAGAPLALESPTIVLRTPGGDRVVALQRGEGADAAWSAAGEGLAADRLSGRLRVSVAGRSQEIDLGAIAAQRASTLTFGDSARLRVLRDDANGVVRLEPVGVRDTQAIQGSPVLVVTSGGATRTVEARPTGAEAGAAWVVQDRGLFARDARVTVKVVSAGRTYELPLPAGPERGSHGGVVTRFEAAVAPLEVIHDPLTGTITIYATSTSTPGLAAPTDAPVIRLDDPTGPRLVTTAPVKDVSGVWRVTAPELAGDISGAVQVKVGDTSYEAPLPTSPMPATPPPPAGSAPARPAETPPRPPAAPVAPTPGLPPPAVR